jgi:hypothetical protein
MVVVSVNALDFQSRWDCAGTVSHRVDARQVLIGDRACVDLASRSLF